MDYLEFELYHHGIKGQKWGVRRYQNEDGTLTEVGKKRYKHEYKMDNRVRKNLEVGAWDSARFATRYAQKSKAVDRRYNNALKKDPQSEKRKTQRLSVTKKYLDQDTENAKKLAGAYVDALNKQVDSMISKYSDTKIKEVKTKTSKDGIEFIKSRHAAVYNANAVYTLSGKTIKDSDKNLIGKRYSPVKARYYYY